MPGGFIKGSIAVDGRLGAHPPSPFRPVGGSLREGTPFPTSGSRPLGRMLTAPEERRLIDYLDAHLQQISREVKRRNASDAHIKSLSDLTTRLSPLSTIILSIPPFSTSAGLRSSYLLRLTGDITDGAALFGASDAEFSPLAGVNGFLDVLDRGWHCCLCGHVWDPTQKIGVAAVVPDGAAPVATPRGVPQTDRVRLSSLLLNLRETLRLALALPPSTVPADEEPPEQTPSMVSDMTSDSGISTDPKSPSDVEATGDAAAAMRMQLDPDAEDSEGDADAEMRREEIADASTAGELQEAVQRLFSRTLRLLNDL